MRVWSPEELRTFLTSVRSDRLYGLWVLLATTGLRRGEAAGLRWDDLDLDAGRLKVIQTIVTIDGKPVIGKPKTENSAREIGLDPQTVAVLRSHRAQGAEEQLALGKALRDADLVFVWQDGNPVHPDVLTKTFQRLAEAAKLPVIRLHDLRHSYASAALEAGVPLKVVSDRLGHGSIAITADLYSHVRHEVDQAAADQVAGLIFGAV